MTMTETEYQDKLLAALVAIREYEQEEADGEEANKKRD